MNPSVVFFTAVLLIAFGQPVCALGPPPREEPAPRVSPDTGAYRPVGQVHRFSGGLDALLAPDAVIEKLTDDVFEWSEGPVWVPDGGYLLFSDVPRNRVWKWSEKGGLEIFMKPSTFHDDLPRDVSDQGTNGLVMALDGRLLAADHGSRSLLSVDLATRERTPLAARFEGKRFNSPNDLAVSRERWPGTLFFTDPPYGLEEQDDSPLKELDFNGVYRLDPSGEVTLLWRWMERPNGIGLSPDEKTLYVANSQRHRSIWMAFDLDDMGGIAGEGWVFASAQQRADAGRKGLPDGMAVDVSGKLWASGPGGIYVFEPGGELLGLIETGTAAANCAFGGEGGSDLYITSDGFLARIRTITQGVEFQGRVIK